MRVTMQTIMAGPQGTADVGETIEVTDKLGKTLKDNHFATEPVARRSSATSDHALAAAITGKSGGPAALKTDGPTVAEFVKAGYSAKNYPPAGYESKSTEAEIADAIAAEEEAAETKAKSPESVKAAIDQLKPDDDEDWTAKGKASVARIKELTGSKSITRDEIDAMFPDFARPTEEAPADDDTNGGGSGGDGGTATPSGRGRTSNR